LRKCFPKKKAIMKGHGGEHASLLSVNQVTKEDFLWKGRVCKLYTKLPTGEWKFYYQTGALNFPPKGSA